MGHEVGNLTIGQYLLIYGCLIIAVIIFLHVRIGVFVATTMRASQNMHNYVFKNLILACMKFFDNNPSGKICLFYHRRHGNLIIVLPLFQNEIIIHFHH